MTIAVFWVSWETAGAAGPIVTSPDVVPFAPDAHWEELEALDATLDGVTVVGLGEGTQGTTEFQYARGPITAWLLEQGFDDVVAEISASWAVSEGMLRGGLPVGTALDAFGGWVWGTVANRDAIEIAAATEAVKSGDVMFTGIDVQDPENNLPDAAALAARLDPPLRDRVLELCAHHPVLGILDDVDVFRARTDALVADLDASTHEVAYWVADLLSAAAHAYANWRLPPRDQAHARDAAMADMVLRHVRRGHRVVVWAHNAHVQADGRDESMGGHLRTALGNAYRSIGTFAASGAYRASLDGNVGVFSMPQAPKGSVERAIESLVPDDAPAAVPRGETFLDRGRMLVRSIGARADPSDWWQFSPREPIARAWDLLVWFREATATDLVE